jgi:tetratricopeptide (TPR) repeat protein
VNFARQALCLTLFFISVFGALAAQPTSFEETFQGLEDEWGEIFYHLQPDQQADKFKSLLPRVQELKLRNPQRAEPLILEAVVLCTLAASDWGISSLTRLSQARDLLVESIDLNPKAMDASAFITLGNLYFRLPGWPISYGDNQIARQYLEAAHKMFPDNLDSNYFLGDFWLREGNFDTALPYFEKADRAPIRYNQRLSDSKIKQELQSALSAARDRRRIDQGFFSSLLPSSLFDSGSK